MGFRFFFLALSFHLPGNVVAKPLAAKSQKDQRNSGSPEVGNPPFGSEDEEEKTDQKNSNNELFHFYFSFFIGNAVIIL